MRSVREREQDSARETIDGLKMKQSREKAQEMEVCMISISITTAQAALAKMSHALTDV